MKIVIIGAMQAEINFLLSKITNYSTIKHYKYTFYEGSLFGKDIVLVASGIGKVASGLLVSALVNYYKDIDLIINVGVSGGILNKVNIGDVVVADSLKYADVDVYDNEYGRMPNCPASFPTRIDQIRKMQFAQNYKIGTIITGDQFYKNFTVVDNLINTYFLNDNVLCIDMESGALAHSSWFYEIDYLAIRSISDIVGSTHQDKEFENNLELACINSNLFLLEVLEKI